MTDFLYNNNLYKIHFQGRIDSNDIKLVHLQQEKSISEEGYTFIQNNWKGALK